MRNRSIKLAYIAGQIAGYRKMGYKKRPNTLVRQTAEQLISELKNSVDSEVGGISLPQRGDWKIEVNEGATYGPILSAVVVGITASDCYTNDKPNATYGKVESALMQAMKEMKKMIEDLGLIVINASFEIATPTSPQYYSLMRDGRYSGIQTWVIFDYPNEE